LLIFCRVRKNDPQYQRMIRELLDAYTSACNTPATKRPTSAPRS